VDWPLLTTKIRTSCLYVSKTELEGIDAKVNMEDKDKQYLKKIKLLGGNLNVPPAI